MNRFIVLYGPTAVGKTDFSLELAKQIGAEIINMDVGQFYEPLSIGTAKPDWKNSAIPHHLFDVLKDPKNFTVFEYASHVKPLFCDIWERKKIPLLVGGSGFYLHNLLFPVACEENNEEKDITRIVDEDVSWDLLHSFDPERAKKIHPHDMYRVSRAFCLYKKMSKTTTAVVPQFDPITPCFIINLSRNVDELYDRINKRTEIMFDEGFIAEVQKLLGTPWEDFMLQKKLIGYNEVIHAFKNQSIHKEDVLQQLKHTMLRRTRRYAKRQRTFWRYLEKKINSIADQKICRTYSVDLSGIKKDLLIPYVLDKIGHYV